MSNQAQINANRLNAQKSTGPRSAEGKAKVAKNAVKHGVFASQTLINGENREDFDLFREQLLGELAPAGAVESLLAERIVSLSWRLKRIERIQDQAIDAMIDKHLNSPVTKMTEMMLHRSRKDKADDPESDMTLGKIAIKDYSNSRVLERLLMYERRLENSMFKTMAKLQKRQLMRELEQANAEAESAQKEQENHPQASLEAAWPKSATQLRQDAENKRVTEVRRQRTEDRGQTTEDEAFFSPGHRPGSAVACKATARKIWKTKPNYRPSAGSTKF